MVTRWIMEIVTRKNDMVLQRFWAPFVRNSCCFLLLAENKEWSVCCICLPSAQRGQECAWVSAPRVLSALGRAASPEQQSSRQNLGEQQVVASSSVSAPRDRDFEIAWAPAKTGRALHTRLKASLVVSECGFFGAVTGPVTGLCLSGC